MDQRALQEISLLLNAFPQGRDTDAKALLYAFKVALEGISAQVIADTARKFLRGEVAGQDTKYAPSPAEFAREARRRQKFIDDINTPKLARRQDAEPENRVSAERFQALKDVLEGKMSWETFHGQ